MKKIIVLSDSHGDTNDIKKIISQYDAIKDIIFLGDCAEDINKLVDINAKSYYIVNGNCDKDMSYNETLFVEFENIKILCTHGHQYNIQESMDKLKELAIKKKAKIVLYGHTHICSIRNYDDIIFLNPGAIGKFKSYKYMQTFAILKTDNNKIEISIKTLPI